MLWPGLPSIAISDPVLIAAYFFALIAGLSCIYWALAWWQVETWQPQLPEDAGPLSAPDAAGISIIKPLHGIEPELSANLQSFLAQRYPRFEMLCGVQDSADPVLLLLAELSERSKLRIIRHATTLGSNPKVNNLAGIIAEASYPILVLADADIRVGPSYLAHLVRELNLPEVGVVSCLYRARPLSGFSSQLLAVQIQEHFLPSVRLAAALGPNVYCGGATIAVRRESFDAMAGCAALADELADDYALGARIRALGYQSVLSDYVVETLVAEDGFAAFYAHALRWARTTRAVQPWGHAFSFLTYPVPLVLMLAVFWQGWAWSVVALVACLRLVYHWRIGRKLRSPLSATAVLVADILGLWIWGHAQVAGKVRWRGRNFSIDAHGQMHDGVQR
ncbi:bacteriohopanetetrol glucosamine biosynthesis glycosyltransferase HpnI [Acidithiobacillus sp. AMEEHan]|uniref:bacteriohopanetetrol glucosamine biosynthesis glycosyltransferase HpnI n=1 Tax=Acidithiobacillus sp. AMEEHan TaxID=2994951 RepID=UPI0027E4DC74|nr:bacteriohopanetetrol glucosamine biosynthesis glycosyltransferase HpnI [Acidithiobacillus sp. AMEEHan]